MKMYSDLQNLLVCFPAHAMGSLKALLPYDKEVEGHQLEHRIMGSVYFFERMILTA